MTVATDYNYSRFSYALGESELDEWLKYGPHPADPAPDFELEDLDGHRVRLSDLRGQPGQALADGGFEPLTETQIASVTAPALVITGANSPNMFRRLAGLLAALLPNSRTATVPAASHAMHIENPTPTNEAMLRFLADVSGQQG
jgi:pimeloyl-ACP methyl ester carboxylesterase